MFFTDRYNLTVLANNITLWPLLIGVRYQSDRP